MICLLEISQKPYFFDCIFLFVVYVCSMFNNSILRACLAIRGCTTPLTSLFSLIFFFGGGGGSTLDHFV